MFLDSDDIGVKIFCSSLIFVERLNNVPVKPYINNCSYRKSLGFFPSLVWGLYANLLAFNVLNSSFFSVSGLSFLIFPSTSSKIYWIVLRIVCNNYRIVWRNHENVCPQTSFKSPDNDLIFSARTKTIKTLCSHNVKIFYLRHNRVVKNQSKGKRFAILIFSKCKS